MEALSTLIHCLEKKSESRSDGDLEIIASHLKILKVLQYQPQGILDKVSIHAVLKQFPPGSTIIAPGNQGTCWYAVISGQLQVKCFDRHDASKEPCCSYILKEGSSFGECVINKCSELCSHSVSTLEESSLFCIETQVIREVYEEHGVDVGLLACWNQPQRHEELKQAGYTLRHLIQSHYPRLLSPHPVQETHCCSGRGLVDWVVEAECLMVPWSREHAKGVWQILLQKGVIHECGHEYAIFQDDPDTLYYFNPHLLTSSPSHSPTEDEGGEGEEGGEDVSAHVEDCLSTIAQFVPDQLVQSLTKSPPDRTSEDLSLIFDEIQQLTAFAHFQQSVRWKLAECIQVETHSSPGQFVFTEGEKAKTWYVILKGSVNVLHGKDIICTLHEEDEFGREALEGDGQSLRATSVQLREEECIFLRVEVKDFHSIHQASRRVVADGGDEPDGVMPPSSYIEKGTPEDILDHVVKVHGANSANDTFVEDFFLTYPSFMTMSDLCEGLLERYKGRELEEEGTDQPNAVGRKGEGRRGADTTSERLRKQTIVHDVSLWVKLGGDELLSKPTFREFCQQLQASLVKDNLSSEAESVKRMLEGAVTPSVGQLPVKKTTNRNIIGAFKSLMSWSHSQAYTSSGGKLFGWDPNVNSSASSPPLPDLQPPSSSNDQRELCVHADGHPSSVTVHTHMDEKASTILTQACEQLQLRPEEHELCEVTSEGVKKVIKGAEVSVWTKLTTVNGRFFVLSTEAQGKVPSLVLPEQNQRPISPFPVDEHSKELAAHLTFYDFNLFTNIQQMELVYRAFKINRTTTNLDILERRFNEVHAWVITEICREEELTRRSAILQKFIEIAYYCFKFKNLSSFYAILLALKYSPAVSTTRLKLTWKEIPKKQKRQFKHSEHFLDPLLNFKKLREHTQRQSPPVVPYLPIILKDVYGINEHNKTFTEDQLVNFEKMFTTTDQKWEVYCKRLKTKGREANGSPALNSSPPRMVAARVRKMDAMRRGVLPDEVEKLVAKNMSLQEHIRALKVIDNPKEQMKMSLDIEPRSKHTKQ